MVQNHQGVEVIDFVPGKARYPDSSNDLTQAGVLPFAREGRSASPKKVWIHTICKLRGWMESFSSQTFPLMVFSMRNILLVIAGYVVSFHCHEGSWTGWTVLIVCTSRDCVWNVSVSREQKRSGWLESFHPHHSFLRSILVFPKIRWSHFTPSINATFVIFDSLIFWEPRKWGS